MMSNSKLSLSRRQFLGGVLSLTGSLAIYGALPSIVSAQAQTNALGVELPADALPLDEQVWLGAFNGLEGKYNDVMRSMYERIGSPWYGQEALTAANADNEVIPAAATEWSVSEDGLTWTFKIRDGLQFSDGTPLTAHDFEWSMKYALNGADHVYDFAWFWYNIVGAQAAAEGTGSPDDIGIKAVD